MLWRKWKLIRLLWKLDQRIANSVVKVSLLRLHYKSDNLYESLRRRRALSMWILTVKLLSVTLERKCANRLGLSLKVIVLKIVPDPQMYRSSAILLKFLHRIAHDPKNASREQKKISRKSRNVCRSHECIIVVVSKQRKRSSNFDAGHVPILELEQ